MYTNNKVAIICCLDGYANSSKPVYIKNKLDEANFDAQYINTLYLGRFSNGKLGKYLPKLTINGLAIYFSELMMHLIRTRLSIAKKLLYYFTELEMNSRAKIVYKLVKNFDIVISESMHDSYVFLKDLKNTKTIYDCATPFADEMFYGGELTIRQYNKFKEKEINVYRSVNHLSFHWYCYAKYVKKYYEDTGNIFKFDFGVPEKKVLAKFNSKPKIAYLGYLGGYWINLPLLSKLSSLYDIDVYGSPEPAKKYKLNYKGYANPDVLANYQFGLITISKDRLRSEGFSAKHLEYLSYGLPVLVPDWRVSARDIKGTVFYTEDNFSNVIKEYSKRQVWSRLSKQAIEQASMYDENVQIKNLLRILKI